MKKILGLDLGVASIGWAFIEEDDKQSRIVGMGVRIIPMSADERDEFNSGNAISKNAKRRIKRGMRRNIYRRSMRKDLLKSALVQAGMLPSKEQFHAISKMQLWELRAKAAKQRISLDELGRVLFHLNQKRGFKSNRKTDGAEEDAKKESEYKAEIRKNASALQESGLTLGQWMLQELTNDEHFKLKGKIFPRDIYIQEFDQIWMEQSQHHAVLTESLRLKIRDGIVFNQRPLKSQKALVSRCEFVKRYTILEGRKMVVSPRVAPVSSPIAQLARIYEKVNTIEFGDRYSKKIEFDRKKLKAIAAELRFKEKISNKDVAAELGMPKEARNNLQERGLVGDSTFAAIAKVLAKYDEGKTCLERLKTWDPAVVNKTRVDKSTGEVIEYLEVDESCERHPYYQLWHALYSVDHEAGLLKRLMNDYQLSEPCARELMKLDFTKAGFTKKSAKAMRLILPYLYEGHVYSQAMAMAGMRHSDYLDKVENEARELLDRLPNLQKNSLRQPVVEKVLNQLINIINAIIDHPEYGRPDEIRVELARALQQSREERSNETQRISKAEKRNKEIEEKLKGEYGFQKVTRSLINKYKIYEECQGVSLYTGKRVALADFLNGAGVEVEHIIPRSKLFDDSMSNKTLAESWVNKAKGNMTARDFLENQVVPGLRSFEDYSKHVDELFKTRAISYTKMKRLMCEEKEIPNDFISRQLRQTQYISKKAHQILALVSRNVHATSGSVTDYLRDKWGWNDVLKRIHWERYEKLGLTSIEERDRGQRIYNIEGWSKRDDHRHHAIDALVVACTKQSYIHTLNNLRQLLVDDTTQTGLKEMDHVRLKDIAGKSPFTTEQIIEVTERIVPSFKAGKRVASKSKNKATGHVQLIPRGALSEETVYGKIKQQVKRTVALNKNFDPSWLIVDPQMRALVKQRLEEHDNNAEKAFKKKLFWDNSETQAITKVEIWDWQEETVVKYNITSLKLKDLDYIVDDVVKAKLKAFFASYPNEKDAIKNLGTQTIWFNEAKRIPIRSVRLRTGLGKVVPVKEVEPGQVTGYVNSGNNHHLAVYERPDGTLFDRMFTFQEAFAALAAGLPVYQKTWEDGALKWKFEQNEMYLLNPNAGVQRHYRVQKISKKSGGQISIVFRLVTESNLKDDKITSELGFFYEVQSLGKLSSLNPESIKVNLLGHTS
jgi:CRISPR-associated endonuclease Csn1